MFYRQFIEKGYVNGNLDSADTISERDYNNHLYQLFSDDITCFSNCGKQIQHLISLHSLSLSAKITNLLTEIGLGSPVISTRPVFFFNNPKLAKM